MSQRIEYYDFLRGIAIIMVVGIHTFVSYPIDTLIGCAYTVIRQILNCAVPIFLALSGLFCGKKIFENNGAIINFWKKQIPKVYIPVLIWSLPYLLQAIVQNKGDMVVLVKQLGTLFVCGYSIYYFIALIVQYYLLLPILQNNKTLMLPISIVLSISSILVITYTRSVLGIELPLIVYAGPFTTWFVFFMIGVYYATSPINYTLKQSMALIVIGLILECIETYYLNINYGGGYGIKLSAFIYSIGVVMLILSPKVRNVYKSNKLTSIIAYIGKISFGIYLIHCFVIKVVNFVLPIKVWVISWLMVIIITSIVIMTSRKFIPQKINRYLGFL